MTDSSRGMEERFEDLVEEVRALTKRVDELSSSLSRVSQVAATPASARAQSRDDSEEELGPIWEGVSIGAVLSSAASVCFLLALALVLRAVVDMRIIDQRFGTVLGLLYGLALIVYGHYRFSRSNRLIPVFAISGGFLISAIVLETVLRFKTLPVPGAMAILAATVLIMAAIGIRHRVPSIVAAGSLAVVVVGLAINLYTPAFAYMAGLLMLTNITIHRASRERSWRWLLYAMFGCTAFFWLFWMRTLWVGKAPGVPGLAQSWYIPYLCAYWILYTALTTWSALREKRLFRFYEAVLPCMAGLGAWLLFQTIVDSSTGVFILTTLLSITNFILAKALLNRDSSGRAFPAFSCAGLMLAAAALHALLGPGGYVLAAWSLLALGAVYVAFLHNSVALHLTASGLQVLVLVGALRNGVGYPLEAFLLGPMALTLLFAGTILAHYLLFQRRSTAEDRPVATASLRIAAAMLALFVVHLFSASRQMLFLALTQLHIPLENTFPCYQTVLINLGAVLIAYIGLKAQKREWHRLGILVAVVGVIKVFLFDLPNYSGFPVVLSVASLGVTAAAGSFILTRWQNVDTADARIPETPAAEDETSRPEDAEPEPPDA